MIRKVKINMIVIIFFYKKIHRLNGPAVIYYDGRKEWWVHGKRHRLNGPAIIYPDGSRSWYKNGELLYSKIMMK